MNLSGNKIWFLSFSSVIILIGMVFIFMGGLKPGIDFTGGSSLTIKLSSYDSSENIREALVGTEVESEYERDPNSEGGPMRIVISELDYSNNIVSFDVIGFLDDSVAGARLTFTTATQSDGSFTVTEVQYRSMCRRGGGPGSDLCL